MDKHLRIILELVTHGFNSGAKGAAGIFKGFISSITSGAANAGRSLLDLAKNAFFVREALETIAGAARWVFDTFIQGAGASEKLEAKLKNVTGSAEDAARVMDLMRQTAADTGADFDELASGASLLAVAAKDASGNFDFEKFQRLNGMLQRIAALRPDVPIDRLARGLANASKGDWSSLELFLDVQLRQLIGLKDAAEDVEDSTKSISQGVWTIETKTGQAADDALADLDKLDEALEKAGATSELIGDIAAKSGMERFLQILDQIARIVGKPLFDKLNDELTKLSDWLQAHPEEVERFATVVGETLAGGLEKLFDALENIDWDKVAKDFDSLMTAIQNGDWGQVKQDIQAIGDAVQTIADAIDAANRAIETAKQLGFIAETARKNPELAGRAVGEELGGQAGGDVGELLGKATEINQRANQLGGGPGGLAGAVAEEIIRRLKIEVHVTSDDEKFRAYTKQIADDSVTDGLNTVSDELERVR